MMEWLAEWARSTHACGRELVVWGTGYDACVSSPHINRYADIAFYVSRDWQSVTQFLGRSVCSKEKLSPELHYVLIVTTRFSPQVQAELEELGFQSMYDYVDLARGLPCDIEYRGKLIGKKSYFPNAIYEYIESVGRFTSINGTALAHSDHALTMISTGLVSDLMSDEDRASYSQVIVNSRRNKSNRVKIGNDVWIGANVFINASRVSEIGDGAIIGAGAIVNDNVPPYAICVGVPAKVKKYRFTPERIEILERVKWWEWDERKIRENARLLMEPERFFAEFRAK